MHITDTYHQTLDIFTKVDGKGMAEDTWNKHTVSNVHLSFQENGQKSSSASKSYPSQLNTCVIYWRDGVSHTTAVGEPFPIGAIVCQHSAETSPSEVFGVIQNKSSRWRAGELHHIEVGVV